MEKFCEELDELCMKFFGHTDWEVKEVGKKSYTFKFNDVKEDE